MSDTIEAQILVRRDTAANLATFVPAQGEPVYETDTELLKVGDGVSPTANLPAVSGGSAAADIPFDAPSQTYKPASGTPAIPSLDPTTGLLPPATMTVLDARYPSVSSAVKPWAPSTVYALGQPVVSPAGDVVTAATAHTSGATFSGLASAGGNWHLSTTFARPWAPTTVYQAGQPVITPSGDLAVALTSFTSGATFSATNWNIRAASLAPLSSPVFSGVPTAPTPAANDNSIALATTAWVQALFATVASTFGVAAVAWNPTAQAWSAATRPTALIVLLLSTNDPAATAPSWKQNFDAWIKHPDATP